MGSIFVHDVKDSMMIEDIIVPLIQHDLADSGKIDSSMAINPIVGGLISEIIKTLLSSFLSGGCPKFKSPAEAVLAYSNPQNLRDRLMSRRMIRIAVRQKIRDEDLQNVFALPITESIIRIARSQTLETIRMAYRDIGEE
jgi:hypothetical protein